MSCTFDSSNPPDAVQFPFLPHTPASLPSSLTSIMLLSMLVPFSFSPSFLPSTHHFFLAVGSSPPQPHFFLFSHACPFHHIQSEENCKTATLFLSLPFHTSTRTHTHTHTHTHTYTPLASCRVLSQSALNSLTVKNERGSPSFRKRISSGGKISQTVDSVL